MHGFAMGKDDTPLYHTYGVEEHQDKVHMICHPHDALLDRKGVLHQMASSAPYQHNQSTAASIAIHVHADTQYTSKTCPCQ
jgi:hypothetical protein